MAASGQVGEGDAMLRDESAEVRRIAPLSQVVSELETQLLHVGPRVGATAPTEDDLVADLRVSRRNARDALAVLELFGVVDAGGTLASTSGPEDGIGRLLRLSLRCAQIPGDELLAVRTRLERTASARAAVSAADDDKAELRRLVTEMAHPRIPPDRFQDLDTAFHLVIARASGSHLCAQLMLGLRDAMADQMASRFAAVANWPATARRLSREHQGLTVAIAHGLDDLAARRVEAHLHGFYQGWGASRSA
jgi:GntR family transcriptional regulator, transcriptional repressor for pyruvate dehydrogenase complex